jgi:hypothetical protein
MKQRFFAVVPVFAIWLVCTQCGAQPGERASPTLEPKTVDWHLNAEAVVSVEPKVVAAGSSFAVTCELRCTSGAGELFNPFLWEGYDLPAHILITSVDGRIRKQLPTEASSQDDAPTKWALIGSGQSIGRTFTVRVVEQLRTTRNDSQSFYLPPGDYDVQAIYTHWLLAPRPSSVTPPKSSVPAEADEPQPFNSWSEAKMQQPLVVSKPVRVTVESTHLPVKSIRGDNALQVELRPAPIRAIYGRKVEIEVRMSNQSDKSIEVYDARLNGFLWAKRAVALAVLDTDGNFLGDLLLRNHGSSKSPSKADWLTMPPGATVSTTVRFTAGKVPSQELGVPNDLPPGNYWIELRVHDHVTSGRPDVSTVDAALRKAAARAAANNQLPLTPIEPHPENDRTIRRSYDEWERTRPGPEICASKRIAFEILPRSGD